MFVQIPADVLGRITDPAHERNIYVHPNPLARAIFWQRLEVGYQLLARHSQPGDRLLDFGGGSGTFLPTLAARFQAVSVIDRDLDDARQIVAHFRLQNVTLHEADVTAVRHEHVYDVVTAMDVLEHFADKSVPLKFFAEHLKPGGILLVSLPTENWLYELGRVIVRKTKPADHYHTAREVLAYYEAADYLRLLTRFVPRLGPLAAPLFEVAVLRKPARRV